jgi:hypothetical protein
MQCYFYWANLYLITVKINSKNSKMSTEFWYLTSNCSCLFHRFRLRKRDDYFWVNFDHFYSEGQFLGRSENWLELKIKPPKPNLACLNCWDTLYNSISWNPKKKKFLRSFCRNGQYYRKFYRGFRFISSLCYFHFYSLAIVLIVIVLPL